jgi:hypothetical protein
MTQTDQQDSGSRKQTGLSLAVLLVAGAAGWLASSLKLPLAWVMGPLIVSAFFCVMGGKTFAPGWGRKFGQLIVGSSVGLSLTSETPALIAEWFPLILLTPLVSVLVCGALSVPFGRLCGLNRATAYFALTPGGLAEMARTGEAEGAKTEAVALSQTIRVAILVICLPWLLLTLGHDGGMAGPGTRPVLDLPELAIVFLASATLAVVVRSLKANNSWMIGGLLGGGILAASGLIEGRVPYALFAVGQIMIGVSIGVRFKREALVELPKVAVASGFFVLLVTGVLIAYAALASLLTGIDLSEMTLAASPGGLAEMALTAGALHLNMALVTTFHLVRSFMVNAWSLQFYRALQRVGFFTAIERLFDGKRA